MPENKIGQADTISQFTLVQSTTAHYSGFLYLSAWPKTRIVWQRSKISLRLHYLRVERADMTWKLFDERADESERHTTWDLGGISTVYHAISCMSQYFSSWISASHNFSLGNINQCTSNTNVSTFQDVKKICRLVLYNQCQQFKYVIVWSAYYIYILIFVPFVCQCSKTYNVQQSYLTGQVLKRLIKTPELKSFTRQYF